MNTCLHCGHTNKKREFDGAIGRLVIKRLGTNLGIHYDVAEWDIEQLCFTTTIDKSFVSYFVHSGICPACDKPSLILSKRKVCTEKAYLGVPATFTDIENIPIYPLFKERPVDDNVPKEIAEDYKEATRIAGLSIKGAATLARRCLQRTLRHSFPAMGKQPSLKHEIDWAIANGNLPLEINDVLYKLKDAGNFGAHPGADGLTEIYELSPEDLEACFVLLHSLFDILYVEPARKTQILHKLKNIPPSKK